MPERSMLRAFRGAALLLAAAAIVACGAWMTVWGALALHAAAAGVGGAQGLLQRRFGAHAGLPGISVLPIATAFACSTALLAPLDASLWWPVAVAMALVAGLLLLAPAMALCEWAGLREPAPALSDEPPLRGTPRADRVAGDRWFELGNTGCRARVIVTGEICMGGPETLAYTLDNGLCLPGEDSATSSDGRWWVLHQRHRSGCAVVDLQARVVYGGDGIVTDAETLAAGPLSETMLLAMGFSPVRYRLLHEGWWWPELAPEPPVGPRQLGPPGGEAQLQLTAVVDRARVLEAFAPLDYRAAPDWAVADARGPLPLRLPGGSLDAVVWQADGRTALLPVASDAGGASAPASWYLWRDDAPGAWFDPGAASTWGIPGASGARPVRLEGDQVWLAVEVGVEPSAALDTWDSQTLDGTTTFGSMPWPLAARADGSIDAVEVQLSLRLHVLRSLAVAADSVEIEAIEVEQPDDRRLRFVPERPRHAALRPGEVRPFRCLFDGGELAGIAPLPRFLGDGRFVVLQAVEHGALTPRLHLIDLDTGRVSALERPVAALRMVATSGDTLAWVEVLGQRPANERSDPLRPLRPTPGIGAWGRISADAGQTLVLRSRRACLDAALGRLRLLPPWSCIDAPVSPLQPGDVEYRAPSAGSVLVFGLSHRWRDTWSRDQEPRVFGRLLTAEGHAIGGVAQGLIGSRDGRWLLFARQPLFEEGASHRDFDIADWEIALLDRETHRLHARRGQHFGGLPFFHTFDDDRIEFDTSPEPWWRPEVPRTPQVWSLEGLLGRLDPMPLVSSDGLWQLPDDPVSTARWRARWQAWTSGQADD
jgi:hypothetical protein